MALGMPMAVRTSAHSSAWLEVGATRIGCMSDLRPKVVAGDHLAYPLATSPVPSGGQHDRCSDHGPSNASDRGSACRQAGSSCSAVPAHAKKGKPMHRRPRAALLLAVLAAFTLL